MDSTVTSGQILHATIQEVGTQYRRRMASPVEVTKAILERIEALEPSMNAFITVMPDEALQAAKEAEALLMRDDDLGPLLGIPVTVKDIFDVAGYPTTCASRILRDVVVHRDATTVARMRKSGAVLLGKNNLLEFAYGGLLPEYGPAINPWNAGHTAGGSSSGSAASVAASMSYGSLGTDTAGSIRGPASFCGVVGHKPTYGLVSRYGVVPVSWSLDYAGPMTRSVVDAAIIMDVIAGYDPLDPTSARRSPESFVPERTQDLEGIRVGMLERELRTGVDPEVQAAVEEAARKIEGLGASVEVLDLPGLYESVSYLMVILMAEATSYHEEWIRSRPEDYAPEVRHRLQLGALIPAIDYLRAQRLRRELQDKMAEVMLHFDILILPTEATAAMPLAGYEALLGAEPSQAGGDEDSLAPLFWRTSVFNLTGQPALTLPCGFTSSGLPIGLEIAGRPFEDRTVFRVARAYEEATPWHDRRPDGVGDSTTTAKQSGSSGGAMAG